MRAKCAYYWQKMRLTYLSHFITRQRNVIRDFVLDTKRLERFSIRQCLRLVLKVKPFKIFTAIHNFIFLIRSEDSPFNQ